MSERERRRHEYELRREVEQQAAEGVDPDDDGDDDSARRQRHDDHGLWVEHQIQAAMRRGDFDDLPGAGKPIKGIDRPHDPDWWLKNLVEREQLNAGVLPPALAVRREDADLDATLDRIARESDVRREVEGFNRRVVDARRQLQGGPPVVTATRDVEGELARWRERRLARAREAEARRPPPAPRRGWFRRRAD